MTKRNMMSAKILDGKKTAEKIKTEISQKITERNKQNLQTPGLAVILVGDNPSSATYVGHKQRACKAVGIHSQCHHLPETTSQKDIETLIDTLNADTCVHGILLQLPLPDHIKTDDLLERINPKKDVDGFHPYNLGRLVERNPVLRPCTPHGVITLLKETKEQLAGKHAVIVGASNIVGRPMALELLLIKATVTICHRFTQDLKKHVQEADILISATGHYGVINSDWIKEGTIIIDVGFSRLSNGKITGDIDFESAKEKAAWITPVPGGVGPMTVATLLKNTLMAAELQDK